jgi:hypothetical protein
MTAKIVLTIESDVEAAAKWVKGEVSAGLSTLEQLCAPIIVKIEPQVLADLKAAILFILNGLSSGSVTDLPTLETTVLNALEALKSQLFTIAKGLGSNLLQIIIGLVQAGAVAA